VPFPVVGKARSGDRSKVFEIASGDARWFLKIGERLAPECDRLQWLQGRLPAPEVVAFGPVGGQEALLTSALPGTNLAVLARRLSPDEIVEMLASALRALHSVSANGRPFKAYRPGGTLVHGDACLPNFMCQDDRTVNGYIDLGEMGVGDIEVDLSAAVWSLQYNLRADRGRQFLRAYGLHPTDHDVRRLWTMYATKAALPGRLGAEVVRSGDRYAPFVRRRPYNFGPRPAGVGL
jgi:aminoglycoside phosphotransferase